MFRIVSLGMLLAAAAITALAGGFVVTLEQPQGAGKDTVVVARIYGCQDPMKATVSATAEGVVNGQRRSIPLHLTANDKKDTYEIKREWPSEGTWAISVRGQANGLSSAALLPLGSGGELKTVRPGGKALPVRPFNNPPSEEQIVAALR